MAEESGISIGIIIPLACSKFRVLIGSDENNASEINAKVILSSFGNSTKRRRKSRLVLTVVLILAMVDCTLALCCALVGASRMQVMNFDSIGSEIWPETGSNVAPHALARASNCSWFVTENVAVADAALVGSMTSIPDGVDRGVAAATRVSTSLFTWAWAMSSHSFSRLVTSSWRSVSSSSILVNVTKGPEIRYPCPTFGMAGKYPLRVSSTRRTSWKASLNSLILEAQKLAKVVSSMSSSSSRAH